MINNMHNKKLFIFIHGYGSNGANMKFLIPYFQTLYKDAIFLSPNAPFKVDHIPDGYHWFPIDIMDEEYLFNGVQNVFVIFEKYIRESIEKYNVKYEDVILAGFSQGSTLAIHSSLMLKKPIHAILSFSGGMANPDNKLINAMSHNEHNICLTHGTSDNILPASFSLMAHKLLKKHVKNCQIKIIRDLEHYINNECIDFTVNFLKNIH